MLYKALKLYRGPLGKVDRVKVLFSLLSGLWGVHGLVRYLDDELIHWVSFHDVY